MKSVAAFVVANTLLVSAPVGSPDCGVQGLTLSKTVFGFNKYPSLDAFDKCQSLIENQDQNKDHKFYDEQENIQDNRNVDSPVADDTPSEQGADKQQAPESEKRYNKRVFDLLRNKGLEVVSKPGSEKIPTIKLELGTSPSQTSRFVLFKDSPIVSTEEQASMKVTDVESVSYQSFETTRIILSGKNDQKLEFVLGLSKESKNAQKFVAALEAIVQNIDDVMSTN